MNETKINEVIAEESVTRGAFCQCRYGRQFNEETEKFEGFCLYSQREIHGTLWIEELAPFTVSLDSCRAFEETLSTDEWRKYLIERAISVDICGADFIMFDLDEIMKIDRQSPAQRCEAFLRVVGKWESE